MFEEIGGLPLHPLLIHAAVVFIPLLTVCAVAYAFVPFVRPHLRWVLTGLAVATPGAVFFAVQSGQAFFNRGIERQQITEGFIPVIEQHESYGENAALFTYGLAIVTLVLVYLVAPRVAAVAVSVGAGGGGSAPETTSTPAGPAWRTNPIIRWVLAALVLVLGVMAVYYVYKAGDSGATAVWDGR